MISPPKEEVAISKSKLVSTILKHKLESSKATLYESLLVAEGLLSFPFDVAHQMKSISSLSIGFIPLASYTYESIISTPVRSIKCHHYDVVDLEYLIRFNSAQMQPQVCLLDLQGQDKKDSSFTCPLCLAGFELDSIYIDTGVQTAIDDYKRSSSPSKPSPNRALLIYVKVI